MLTLTEARIDEKFKREQETTTLAVFFFGKMRTFLGGYFS